jgi:hypothetical protein
MNPPPTRRRPPWLAALRLDSHGAQERFIAQVRGRVLRLMRRGARVDHEPLEELEQVFRRQVVFMARNREVPTRMLELASATDDGRIQRRIRKIIGQYEARLARVIARGQRVGLVRAAVEPYEEARLLVALIRGLALRMRREPRSVDWYDAEARRIFRAYQWRLRQPTNGEQR